MFGKKSKVLLIGLGVLTVFDLLTELPFLKTSLSDLTVLLLTMLIYFGIAYEGARLGGVRTAIFFVTLVCVFDWLVTPGLEVVLRTAKTPFSVGDWLLGLVLFYLPLSILVGSVAAVIVRLSVKNVNSK